MSDQEEIRQLLDNWVIWRDSGDWDRFATLWHPEGRMIATWFQASATDFIARARAAWDQGSTAYHFLGGSSIEVQDSRAIAQTKMQIIQRAQVHEVPVEVICSGRFWDALEKRNGHWRLLLRQPIYEMDRMSTVSPSARVELDPNLLASFPEGYRHLGYLQSQIGFKVNKSLPGTRGPQIETLQAHGQRWLAGDPSASLDLSWIAD
ncbi:MAG TPA: nuclear transport factor 2 family protein [Steroidobacteraceae bacterium]